MVSSSRTANGTATMAKYTILILVIALASFLLSATARPNNYDVQRDPTSDAFNRRVTEEIQSIPDQTWRDILTARLEQAEERLWNNAAEYRAYITYMLSQAWRDVCENGRCRSKREVDFHKLFESINDLDNQHYGNINQFNNEVNRISSVLEQEVNAGGTSQIDSHCEPHDRVCYEFELLSSKEIQELYVRVLIRASPPAYKSSLKQEYEKLLQENTNGVDFLLKLSNTFEEVTGFDFSQYFSEHYEGFTNKLNEVLDQAWDSYEEFKNAVISTFTEFLDETDDDELFRSKRETKKFEEGINEIIKSKEFYEVYVRFLIALAPSAHRLALKQKFEEALKGNYNVEQDLHEKSSYIYEEVTGLNLYKRLREFAKEFENKFGPVSIHEGNDFEEYKNIIIRTFSKAADYLEESNTDDAK